MCGCKCLRKEEMGGGRLHKEGGVRGRAARVMGVSGPKQDLRPNTPTRWLPTPMQAPNQRNSTALLVNVFPQIPNSQNATTEREKKNKKNTLQLLFFANRVSHHHRFYNTSPRRQNLQISLQCMHRNTKCRYSVFIPLKV
jgi:hypothetical protein